MKFVATCTPEWDESPVGYLLRTLAVNGFRRKAHIRGKIDRRMISGLLESIPFENGETNSAEFFGLSKQEWWRHHSRPVPDVDVTMYSHHRMRICPLCIGAREVRSWHWDVPPITSCVHHGCLLQDSCWGCGSPITGSSSRLAHCGKCGAAFRDAEVKKAGISAQRLTNLLCDGLQGWPQVTRPFGGVTAAAAIFFGKDTQNAVWRENKRLSVEEALVDCTRAYDVLGDWPEGLYRWLDIRRSSVPDTLNLAGFGPWLLRLRTALGGSDEVMDAAGRYFAERWTGIPIKPTSPFARAGFPDHLMRLKDVRATLRCNVNTVKRLIAEGRLIAYREKWGKRYFTVIERTSVDEVLRNPVTYIDCNEAARRLGVGPGQIKFLWRAGFLDRFSVKNVASVRERSLDELCNKLAQRSAPKVGDDEFVTLADLPTSHYERLSAVISRILAGDLACYQTDGFGLAQFLIKKMDIFGYRVNGGIRTCSYGYAAKRLSLKSVMIKPLIKVGCLTARRDDRRVHTRTIDLASVEAYPIIYVGTSELMREWRSNAVTVISRLVDAGLTPVVKSHGRLGISSVWIRAEVEAATISREPLGFAKTAKQKTSATRRRPLARSVEFVEGPRVIGPWYKGEQIGAMHD